MKQILDKIDKCITRIWETKIKQDYDNGWILREDTLKDSLYFHLRNSLNDLFEKNNLRIFTEYGTGIFKGTGYRPDMVIAKVDLEKEEYQYENCIEEVLCVIEIKNLQGFYSHKIILNDFEKLKKYSKIINLDCKFYMATIWEYEDEQTSWIKDAKWCKGRLTELNASYKNSNGDSQFYISKH